MTAEVYKWRYGIRQTERLNFIKGVMYLDNNDYWMVK
jgi:hypothetical protein